MVRKDRDGAGSFLFRAAPNLVIFILIGPVVAGLLAIVAPAFNLAPLFGATELSLAPFAAVLSTPGIGMSIWLSFWVGPATAFSALVIVAGFAAAYSGSRLFGAVTAFMRPVLAVPHAAAAFGLAFLVAPSGFLVRLFSPGVTGFDRPPDWLILNDPWGLTMFVGLLIKEVPFLMLVVIAALPQAGEGRARIASSLGYGKIWGWLTSVFPGVYRQVRLPVYAVIAFATSVVDVALILGPGTPPPLAVRVLHLMNDPDLDQRLTAAAMAILQIGVTAAAILSWWGLERLTAGLWRWVGLKGWRFTHDGLLRRLFGFAASGSFALVIAGLGLLLLWSIAGSWRFPEAFAMDLDFSTWRLEGGNLLALSGRTALIAAISALVATFLVVLCLENEYRQSMVVGNRAMLILYLPLLVPQIAFVGGLSTLLLWLRIDGVWLPVVLSHLVFVVPYVYLTLVDPYHAVDRRYFEIARALGKNADQVFLSIRLPMLAGPILAGFALGFAVSVTQYLPTLLVGAGRLPTITTEAVALGSGGNRRLIGVYGLIQTLLPFAVFALAGLVPALIWRNRRLMRAGGAR